MADEFRVHLEGIEELRRVLESASKTIRTRSIRRALRAAGAAIRAKAKSNAPTLSVPVAHRKKGTVKRNISVRISKFAKAAGDEGVFIGVRPLKGEARVKKFGKASAKNPNDPYYWWFLEFGTKKMAKREFLAPAMASEGNKAVTQFMDIAIADIMRLNGNTRNST